MPVRQGEGCLCPCLRTGLCHVEPGQNLHRFSVYRAKLLDRLRECQLVCVFRHTLNLYSQATLGDSRGKAPSPPFEEAGLASGVWAAYLNESWNYDTDMVAEQRGEVNILLVFVS